MNNTSSSITITPDTQYDFAENYFTNKAYLNAVSEFERFIFFFPRENRVKQAMFKIGFAYFLNENYKKAVTSLQALIERYPDTDIAVKAYFMISECYIKQGAFNQAVITLYNLATISNDKNIKDEAWYRMGWIYIETASWAKAHQYFAKISPENREKYRLKTLDAGLEKTRLIKKKNPAVAGILSIVPGGGYLYCERYQDAFIAFLFNCGMIYAAYESFDKDNNALGGIITFVEFGFYSGNIYGAVTSAHKYNRNQTARFLKKLRENTKINLSTGHNKKKVLLTLKYVF